MSRLRLRIYALAIAALALLALAIISPARAGQQCLPYADAVAAAADPEIGEAPAMQYLTMDGRARIVIFISPTKLTVTVFLVRLQTDGVDMACMVSTGTDFGKPQALGVAL